MFNNFAYVRPESLKKASEQSTKSNTSLHAGGIDLLSCLRYNVFSIDRVVSMARLENLRGIKESSRGGIAIGALTTVAELAENPAIKKRYNALVRSASEVASPQLRNQGTICGNICQKPRCW